MVTSSVVRSRGTTYRRGLRMEDLDPKNDMRRLDWLVAPVQDPIWYLFDSAFQDRGAGFRYLPPPSVVATSALTVDAVGADGEYVEMRWEDRRVIFELDDDATVSPGHIPVNISASASAANTAALLAAAMRAKFGPDHVSELQPLATNTVVDISFFGPRLVETSPTTFINLSRGRADKAWSTPGETHLRNIKPPSGFPNVCIRTGLVAQPNGSFLAKIKIAGLDCLLNEVEEVIDLDLPIGEGRFWGKVGWREIHYVEVMSNDIDDDCQISIGWDLNYTVTKAVDIIANDPVGPPPTGPLLGDGDTVTIADGVNPPVTFENDVANDGVVGGNVAFGIGALSTGAFAESLAGAIRGQVTAGNLRADLVATSTLFLLGDTDVLHTVYVTTMDRDDTLTITIVVNNGETFAENTDVFYDTPGEDSDWKLGFPFPFQIDFATMGVTYCHNVDGCNYLEFNAWDWGSASVNRNRMNTTVSGTAILPQNALMGGRVGEIPGRVQGKFNDGEFVDEQNVWIPPSGHRPLCSAGTDGDPVNQTQYRLFRFLLHNRDKIPPRHHGDGL